MKLTKRLGPELLDELNSELRSLAVEREVPNARGRGPPRGGPQPTRTALSTCSSASSLRPSRCSRRPTCASAERGFVEREAARVGVERIPDTQGDGSHVLSMAERQLVEHGHAERLEVMLEHVFERARAGPVGGLALVAPVTVLHLADDDADRLLEL